MIWVPCSFARGINRSPATTILSLFASNILLPVFAANIVASRPANPEIADTTISTLSMLNNFSKSFDPERISNDVSEISLIAFFESSILV